MLVEDGGGDAMVASRAGESATYFDLKKSGRGGG